MTATALLSDDEIGAAGRTCARAMRDNPLHCAVFGSDPERRERRLRGFFAAVLPWILRRGTLLGTAVATASVVGVPSWFVLREPARPWKADRYSANR